LGHADSMTQRYWIVLATGPNSIVSMTQRYWIVLATGPNSIDSCWQYKMSHQYKRKEIQPTQPQLNKNYHYLTFVQYKKKSNQFIISLPYEKNKRKEKKKSKEIKNKI